MKTIDETVKIATERYAKSQGSLASNYKNFRDQVQELLTTFSAEVQEEYRQKVRGQVKEEFEKQTRAFNHNAFSHALEIVLGVAALRDPEPEPSEAAMRVVAALYPKANGDYNMSFYKEIGRKIDQALKGAANPNA